MDLDGHLARFSVQAVLGADPFRDGKRLPHGGEKLDSGTFFSKFFVESEFHKRKASELVEILDSTLTEDKLLFVNGFGGSGKSTFIRYFAREYAPKCCVEVLDLSGPGVLSGNGNPLKQCIRKELRLLEDDDRKAVLRRISRNSAAAYDFFPRSLPYMLEVLAKGSTSRQQWIDLMKGLGEQEMLALYLLCFLSTADPGRQNVLVLDNLDALETDYLTESIQRTILDTLQHLETLLALAEIAGDVANSFRLVVCMREMNHAIINAHLEDHVRPRDFDFFPSGEVQQAILDRRIELLESSLDAARDSKVFGVKGPSLGEVPSAKRINRARRDVRVVQALLERGPQDTYFGDVLAPLFNYNLKSLAVSLVEGVRQTRDWSIYAEAERCARGGGKSVGARAAARYREGYYGAFLKMLMRTNRDFLRLYRGYSAKRSKEEGYCLHHRVLLVVLSNATSLSVGTRSRIFDRPQRLLDADFCSVWSLVQALWRVYPVSEILRTVGECFMVYNTGWGALVLVRNKDVHQDPRFEEEVEWMRKLGLRPEDPSLDELGFAEIADSEVAAHLKRIKVRLNPAGFCYVRHVLTSFEFYAALAGFEENGDHWEQRNVASLFHCGARKQASGHGFLFTEYIAQVLPIVERHVVLMKEFFASRYEEKLGLSYPAFQKGKLSFKFYGREQTRQSSGLPHSFLMLSTHIGYIERFRRYLLDGTDGVLEGAQVARSDINVALVLKLRDYVALLKSVPGADAADYGRVFGERVKRILDSNGRDFSTRVEMSKET